MSNEWDNQSPPQEIETNVPCPVCGANLYFIVYETEIPYEGNIIIQTSMCKRCFYKDTSIQRIDELSPVKINFTIASENDLNVVIYRSPKARISISEIGVEIEPGSSSSGDITTVEGLLMSVRDQMIFISDDLNDEKKFNEILERLNSALNGSGPSLTLSLIDESGISRIASHKAKVTPFDPGRANV
ncbi:MAG: ZPR1 zinc finger domain-containing protein [Thermoplasmataceae archaeon]